MREKHNLSIYLFVFMAIFTVANYCSYYWETNISVIEGIYPSSYEDYTARFYLLSAVFHLVVVFGISVLFFEYFKNLRPKKAFPYMLLLLVFDSFVWMVKMIIIREPFCKGLDEALFSCPEDYNFTILLGSALTFPLVTAYLFFYYFKFKKQRWN